MKDVTQLKKKLKNPQLRVWAYDRKKGGDDYYYPAKWTKENLRVALKTKAERTAKEDREAPLVAYDGKEYPLKPFLKKYPKYNLLKDKVKKKISKKRNARTEMAIVKKAEMMSKQPAPIGSAEWVRQQTQI